MQSGHRMLQAHSPLGQSRDKLSTQLLCCRVRDAQPKNHHVPSRSTKSRCRSLSLVHSCQPATLFCCGGLFNAHAPVGEKWGAEVQPQWAGGEGSPSRGPGACCRRVSGKPRTQASRWFEHIRCSAPLRSPVPNGSSSVGRKAPQTQAVAAPVPRVVRDSKHGLG